MKIHTLSVPVQDQQHALEFYKEKLQFEVKEDVLVGNGHRWLTMVAAEQKEGPQILLEPMAFEPAKVYQKALYDSNIAYTQFEVQDIKAEYERLTKLRVKFIVAPQEMGPAILAIFDDTCGNYIQLFQLK